MLRRRKWLRGRLPGPTEVGEEELQSDLGRAEGPERHGRSCYSHRGQENVQNHNSSGEGNTGGQEFIPLIYKNVFVQKALKTTTTKTHVGLTLVYR